MLRKKIAIEIRMKSDVRISAVIQKRESEGGFFNE